MIACPHCGAEINEDAKFCRHCGSSDSDGWREEPPDGESWAEDDDFDYDQYIHDHHSDSVVSTSTPAVWRWVAILLLVLFAATIAASFFEILE